MADQIATVSKQRPSTRMGILAESDLKHVDSAIRVQLGLNNLATFPSIRLSHG
jgi:mRNA-degrading endonuclease toxin of MazEF toxin-antitoxin module